MINVTVTGNVTKDAETRQVGSDGVTKFDVASNTKVKGEKQVTFISCDIWGKRGAALMPYIKKGGSVTVIGELTKREHDGKTYLGVRVDHIELQGGKSGGSSSGNSPTPSKSTDLPVYNDDSDNIPF